MPDLGPLVLRIPALAPRALREYALLGARLLLVATRAVDGGVEAVNGKSLTQSLRLHHHGVEGRANGIDPSAQALFVDVDDKPLFKAC
jgi:hypothetical protein